MESSIEDLSKKFEETNIHGDLQKTELSDSELLKLSEGLTLEDLNNLIDKLYVEMLNLIEQYIRCKVELEKRQNEGNLLIAKARYIQGGKTVSGAQLPNADSLEFKALVSTLLVNSTENFGNKHITAEKYPVDKSKGFLDPIKWFGVLVPRSLHFAKERYQLAIDLVVDVANVQKELSAVMNYIDQLKKLKMLLQE